MSYGDYRSELTGFGLSPFLLQYAEHAADANSAAEKSAIVPPGGGGDPAAAGGAPPPMDPAAGGGAPPAPGGAAAPPPPGSADPQVVQDAAMQVMQMQQQGGGAGGPMGKGKSPKDQIAQGQMKILIYMCSEICRAMNIKLDPSLMVPMTDPATDQMAIQETMGGSMVPSNDPNAGAGGAPAGGGQQPPGAGMAGPAPMQPMDASQGPVGGKAAGFGAFVEEDLLDEGMGEAWAGIIEAPPEPVVSPAARIRNLMG